MAAVVDVVAAAAVNSDKLPGNSLVVAVVLQVVCGLTGSEAG
jgi:hypothetical protein